MKTFRILPQWISNVTYPIWSRIILQSLFVMLLVIFTIEKKTPNPSRPQIQIRCQTSWIFYGIYRKIWRSSTLLEDFGRIDNHGNRENPTCKKWYPPSAIAKSSRNACQALLECFKLFVNLLEQATAHLQWQRQFCKSPRNVFVLWNAADEASALESQAGGTAKITLGTAAQNDLAAMALPAKRSTSQLSKQGK